MAAHNQSQEAIKTIFEGKNDVLGAFFHAVIPEKLQWILTPHEVFEKVFKAAEALL